MHGSASPLLAALRAATAAAHAELDQRLALLADSVTRERYGAFLLGSLAALKPLETSLTAAPALPVPYRPRVSSLRADLVALGATRQPPELPSSPYITSIAQAWGARYVIEGSALGGVVLARSLAQRLELSARMLNFLTLYSDELTSHWRTFRLELERWDKSATLEMRTEACDTARAVFDSYRTAFERAGAFLSHR